MGDWKDNLFVWKGSLGIIGNGSNGDALYDHDETILYDKGRDRLTRHNDGWDSTLLDWGAQLSFKGSWLGSESGADELSPLRCLVIARDKVFGSGLIDFENDGMGWLATGPQTNGPNYMLAAARGNTEFGPFVSLGFVAVYPERGPALTLCRLYIDENDIRADASVSDEDFLCSMLWKIRRTFMKATG